MTWGFHQSKEEIIGCKEEKARLPYSLVLPLYFEVQESRFSLLIGSLFTQYCLVSKSIWILSFSEIFPEKICKWYANIMNRMLSVQNRNLIMVKKLPQYFSDLTSSGKTLLLTQTIRAWRYSEGNNIRKYDMSNCKLIQTWTTSISCKKGESIISIPFSLNTLNIALIIGDDCYRKTRFELWDQRMNFIQTIDLDLYDVRNQRLPHMNFFTFLVGQHLLAYDKRFERASFLLSINFQRHHPTFLIVIFLLIIVS